MSLYDKMEEQNIQTRVEILGVDRRNHDSGRDAAADAGETSSSQRRPTFVSQHEEKEACYPIDIGLVCNPEADSSKQLRLRRGQDQPCVSLASCTGQNPCLR